MLRFLLCAMTVMAMIATRASACDTLVSVAPSAFVGNAIVAPVAVHVVPTAVFTPLAVQVEAFAVQATPLGVQVLAAPVGVRACLAPRVRAFQRPFRSRVTVRVR